MLGSYKTGVRPSERFACTKLIPSSIDAVYPPFGPSRSISLTIRLCLSGILPPTFFTDDRQYMRNAGPAYSFDTYRQGCENRSHGSSEIRHVNSFPRFRSDLSMAR